MPSSATNAHAETIQLGLGSRQQAQADQRAGLEERLLLGVKPPFATGADRSVETQLSFLRNFLLVDRLGLIAAGRPIELHTCSNPAVSWYNG